MNAVKAEWVSAAANRAAAGSAAAVAASFDLDGRFAPGRVT